MYLWWASLLVIPAALVAVALAVAERRPSTVLVAAVLLGIALVRTIPSGNRVYLLVLGGGIVVFLYLAFARDRASSCSWSLRCSRCSSRRLLDLQL